MKKDTQKIALCDLDGTLADFEEAMRRDLHSLQGPTEAAISDDTNLHDLEGAPHIEARMNFIKARPGCMSFRRFINLVIEKFLVLFRGL